MGLEMPVVVTHNLTKIYGNRVIASNGINIKVEAGCVYGLLGPNGAGKTTLLKLLMGLQAPTAGRAELFGQRVTANSAALRQRVGYLPTNPKFPPNLTPITYLDLVCQLFGMGREERKPKLASLIRAVDLLPAASRTIRGFSTGMTTRLGIAASLINDPELLIWDEPTAGLDPAGRKYTLDLIRELGKTKTIIVSSHILSDIDRVCDHVGIMHDGKLIYSGSVKDLKQTIGRNSLELEIDGPEPVLEKFTARIRASEGVLRCHRTGTWLEVYLSPDASMSGPLAQMLAWAVEGQVEILSVSCARAQTEDAFIHVLEEDQADGFARASDAFSPFTDGIDRAPQG